MSRAVEGTEELAKRFGQALWRTRRRAGFSQEELAVQASLHRTEIGLLEHGHRLPRLDTIIKLAAVLAVPPGDLLDGMSWTPGDTRRGSFLVSDAPSP
jgi:transcriptional regulator with XRE-family HTH domain